MEGELVTAYPHIYEACFDELMEIETGGDIDGGYNVTPGDAGGATKWGVAQRYNPDIDVASLTRDGAKEFYYKRHWQPMGLDLIPNKEIAYEIFENGINSNHKFAVMCAQGALKIFGKSIDVDGKLGPVTAGAIAAFPDKRALLKMQNLLQGMMFLLGFENVNAITDLIRIRMRYAGKFIQGWMKRIEV